MAELTKTEEQVEDEVLNTTILAGENQKKSLPLKKLNPKQRCIVNVNLRASMPGKLTIQTDFQHQEGAQLLTLNSLTLNSTVEPIIDTALTFPLVMITHTTTSVKLALTTE